MGRMEWSGGGKWDNCNSIINKYIKKNTSSSLLYLSVNHCKCFLILLLYEKSCTEKSSLSDVMRYEMKFSAKGMYGAGKTLRCKLCKRP